MRKVRGGGNIISRRKEGLKDNSQPIAETKESKINIENAQKLCSDRGTAVLSPKMSQEEKSALKVQVQILGK